MTETMPRWVLKFPLVHKIGASVGGGATMDDGRLTVGADVKLALGVGVTLQPSVTVDLKPVQKHVVAPVTNAAKATGNAVKKRC
jgi:hypothetical protein